jgi:outer membrane protein TolC
MTTITSVARAEASIERAEASLQIAEARLNGIRDGTYRLVAGDTLEDLKAEVAACREVLAGAQRNYGDTIVGGGRGNYYF